MDPQTWDQYFFHPNVVQLAQRTLQTNQVPRSILVSGPTGVGKGALVRLFLRTLRCQRRPPGGVHGCGVCPQCRTDPRTADPEVHDMLWVQSGSSDDTLNKQIKQALEFARMPPVRREADHRNYKVIVVDELDVVAYPQIVSLYYETEIPQTHGVRTLTVFVTMNELKVKDQQFRALGDRGTRWTLHRLSRAQICEYLRKNFPLLSQDAQLMIAEACEGSIRGALEIVGRARMIDPCLSDLIIATETQSATRVSRQNLWSLVQNPYSRMQDLREALDSLESCIDPQVLARQMMEDVENSIETKPNNQQFFFLTALSNARQQNLPLRTVLALFKGQEIVDPTTLEREP